MGERGQLPKAYLRVDPNIDHAKPGYLAIFIRLLCAAARQPQRGRFKNRPTLDSLLGRAGAKRVVEEGDVVVRGRSQMLYVVGWDEWQEGNHPVGERQRLIRARRLGVDPEELPQSGAGRTANWRLRNRIFERDEYTCRYCGNGEYPREWLVMEHVDPDGPSDETNLVTACRPCNKIKGGNTPAEAGMELLPVPGAASQSVTRDASPPVTPTPPVPKALGRKGIRASTDVDPSLSARATRVELAVDQLLTPRTGTLAQQRTMVDLASQLGETRVLAALEAAAGQDNGYGVALRELQDAARSQRNGHRQRRDPDSGERVAANGTLLSPAAEPQPVATARPRSADA